MGPHYFLLFLLFVACKETAKHKNKVQSASNPEIERQSGLEFIKGITVPPGYKRLEVEPGSFSEWMRNIRLKKDNYVYLYDGSLKWNQGAQFAVLDISVGRRDLQQCADAVIRLRAEYLFEYKRYPEIVFTDNNRKPYKWEKGDDRKKFAGYLENVFGMCGTASLQKQLRKISLPQIQAGDVFIKGGFPGHAMIVVDVAINKDGEKIFMLAQSYMPAQDIHVVRNPLQAKLDPWYEMQPGTSIITPEWTFYPSQLYRF